MHLRKTVANLAGTGGARGDGWTAAVGDDGGKRRDDGAGVGVGAVGVAREKELKRLASGELLTPRERERGRGRERERERERRESLKQHVGPGSSALETYHALQQLHLQVVRVLVFVRAIVLVLTFVYVRIHLRLPEHIAWI